MQHAQQFKSPAHRLAFQSESKEAFDAAYKAAHASAISTERKRVSGIMEAAGPGAPLPFLAAMVRSGIAVEQAKALIRAVGGQDALAAQGTTGKPRPTTAWEAYKAAIAQQGTPQSADEQAERDAAAETWRQAFNKTK